MAGVRLQWAQFGKVEGFNVYRSEVPFNPTSLPPAIATNVVGGEYWDATIEKNKLYYYTVSSQNGLEIELSDEVVLIFTKNTDFVFYTSEGYNPPQAHNVDFNW